MYVQVQMDYTAISLSNKPNLLLQYIIQVQKVYAKIHRQQQIRHSPVSPVEIHHTFNFRLCTAITIRYFYSIWADLYWASILPSPGNANRPLWIWITVSHNWTKWKFTEKFHLLCTKPRIKFSLGMFRIKKVKFNSRINTAELWMAIFELILSLCLLFGFNRVATLFVKLVS